MRYELIVFDLDGTLLDSQAHIIQCAQAVCAQMGLAVPASKDIRVGAGLVIEQQIARLFPELDLTQQQQFLGLFKDCFWGGQPKHGLFEGVEQTLAKLNQLGVFTAIATNMSRYGLKEVLASTALGELVSASRTVDECGAKPCPDMVIELMDFFATEKDKTLMVGDTILDLQCGQHASVDVVAVDYQGMRGEELAKANPILVIQQIAEVLDLL